MLPAHYHLHPMRNPEGFEILQLAAGAFASGFALGAVVAWCPSAEASDDGRIPNEGVILQDPTGQARPAMHGGCSPYVYVAPPEIPPSAQVLNHLTLKVEIGPVCEGWRSKSEPAQWQEKLREWFGLTPKTPEPPAAK